MSGCFVLVNQALVYHLVDNRNSGGIGLNGVLFVSGFDGFHDFLELRTQHGIAAGIMNTPVFRLSRPFFGRCNIGQEFTPV